MMVVIGLLTMGCPRNEEPVVPPGGNENEFSVDFTEAVYEYYFDNFENGTGNFGFSFFSYTEEGLIGLYVDIVSDHFEDYAKAIPETGTYNYATSHAKFTITEDSYFYRESDDQELLISDGSFALTRSGSRYTIDIELELEDGKTLKCDYTGNIYPFFDGGEDIRDSEKDFHQSFNAHPFGRPLKMHTVG